MGPQPATRTNGKTRKQGSSIVSTFGSLETQHRVCTIQHTFGDHHNPPALSPNPPTPSRASVRFWRRVVRPAGQILAVKSSTYFLGEVPELHSLVENMSSQQLAHFSRVLALLVFEPEYRQLMESAHVLRSGGVEAGRSAWVVGRGDASGVWEGLGGVLS